MNKDKDLNHHNQLEEMQQDSVEREEMQHESAEWDETNQELTEQDETNQILMKSKELQQKSNKNTNNKGIAKMLPKLKINVWNRLNIRTKILVAFAVPVLLMGIFGYVSYQKTSAAIIDNYEKSTITTLNATKDYIMMEMSSVSDQSYNLISYDSIKNYFKKSDDATLKSNANYLNMANEVSSAKSSNSLNYNIHIFGNSGIGYSTAGKFPKDIYDNFSKSPEGQMLAASNQRYIWVGKHTFLDNVLKNRQTAYATSIIRKLSENNGVIVIDVQAGQMMKPISQLKIGENSIIGFVTQDGAESLYGTTESSVFKDLSYYKKTLSTTEGSGYSFEKYKGKEYLFLYSEVGNTGATLCALVPKSEILKQANEIKTLVIIFVLIACALATLIGTLIASGIGSEISKLTKSIAKAAKGDLTTKFDTKRKDEFFVLSQSLKGMMEEMRTVIKEVAEVGTRVSNSANSLSGTSTNILDSTKNISLAIDDIGSGVTQQATDTEQCSNMMVDLSNQINRVYQNTYEIEQIAKETTNIIGEGIVIVDELNSKSNATTDITHVVIREIEELELQSHNIQNIIKAINDIAAQTNLLSLNASIEAARAGEAGRGFAVVAEEIRKLADQSSEASNQIKEIVNEIQDKTKTTATSAKQAKSIVESQTEALSIATITFEKINKHVDKLISNLNNIADEVKGIEAAKDNSLDAISNISAISEETASSSEEVSATALEQINSVEYLSRSAEELAEEARVLERSILMFKVSEE